MFDGFGQRPMEHGITHCWICRPSKNEIFAWIGLIAIDRAQAAFLNPFHRMLQGVSRLHSRPSLSTSHAFWDLLVHQLK